MPRVSVIVPAFNAEEHLGEALASVAGQAYRDWEVVVGDDGSTDRTAEIVEGLDERYRLARSGRNLGPANGRNVAIAAATGELLATLDSDDLWLPGYLEGQVRRYDEAVAAGRRVGIVSSNARVLLRGGGYAESTYADEHGSPEGVTLTGLLEHNPIFVGALMPRDVVDEAGGFSIETWGSEDHDLFLRIVENGYEVVANPEPNYVYRQGAATLSANLFGMARTSQATYRRALERGKLDPRQRRIAKRQLRLQMAVEQFARIKAAPSPAARLGRTARAAPLLALVAGSHPRRWRSWLAQARSAELGGELRSRV